MNQRKMILCIAVLASQNILAEEKVESFQHEINYGIINLESFSFIDMDFSEFPLVGASYKYYFDPVEISDVPYALAADLSRTSWLSFDVNAITGVTPNIGGHIYFDDKWSLEADFIYVQDSYESSNSSREEDELFVDVTANYQIDQNWQVGLGARMFSERSEYRDDIIDYTDSSYSETESESSFVFQTRYTNIESSKGWDVLSSFSTSEDFYTFKTFATYYTSKKNGLTFGLVHYNDKSDSDALTALSFSHRYWFSESTSIDYGVSHISDEDGSWALFDINGTWRF